MKPRDRLRIAMQKSGRLTEPAQELLARCGLKFRQSRDKLFCFGEGEPVDLLLVRDDDIPGLIAEGVCDLGIVGRNVLREFQLSNPDTGKDIDEVRSLGFGHCRLSIAVPQEDAYDGPAQLHGQRIATSYPGLLGEWLRTNGVDAKVVMLAGSVEIAPRLGTADAICDLFLLANAEEVCCSNRNSGFAKLAIALNFLKAKLWDSEFNTLRKPAMHRTKQAA